MPNWCTNEVTFSGPTDVVRAFMKQAGHPRYGTEFKFNNIMPMPEELKDIFSGGVWIEGVPHEHWREPSDDVRIPLTKEEIDDLLSHYGAVDIYDWCEQHWGTKWDAHYSEYYGHTLDHEPNVYDDVSVSFETAWSPPEELYNHILKHWPKLEVDWFYKEPGMRFAGWLGEHD